MSIRATNLGKSLRRNAPKIFKIAGLVGLLVTPVLTVPSTVKAVRACDRRKEELEVEKLPWKEIVKVSWPYYIPIVSLMGVSTVSMVNGESISNKRTAIISAACNAAEQTLLDYKDETKKLIGEDKQKEIEDEVLRKQAERVVLRDDGPFAIQGRGDTLFYEPVTGTPFYSTRTDIDNAFNELSAKMISEIYVDLGDLFDLIGLRRVEACNGYGWNSMRVKVIRPDIRAYADERTYKSYSIMGYEQWPTTNYMDD